MRKQVSSPISPFYYTDLHVHLCSGKWITCQNFSMWRKTPRCFTRSLTPFLHKWTLNLNHMLLNKVPIADGGERSYRITPMMSAHSMRCLHTSRSVLISQSIMEPTYMVIGCRHYNKIVNDSFNWKGKLHHIPIQGRPDAGVGTWAYSVPWGIIHLDDLKGQAALDGTWWCVMAWMFIDNLCKVMTSYLEWPFGD